MYCIRIGIRLNHSPKPFEIDVYIALQREFSTSKRTFMYLMLITVIFCIWWWLAFCNVKHWIHGPYWKRTQTNWIPHNTYIYIYKCISICTQNIPYLPVKGSHRPCTKPNNKSNTTQSHWATPENDREKRTNSFGFEHWNECGFSIMLNKIVNRKMFTLQKSIQPTLDVALGHYHYSPQIWRLSIDQQI